MTASPIKRAQPLSRCLNSSMTEEDVGRNGLRPRLGHAQKCKRPRSSSKPLGRDQQSTAERFSSTCYSVVSLCLCPDKGSQIPCKQITDFLWCVLIYISSREGVKYA